jgi:hypothetical protein
MSIYFSHRSFIRRRDGVERLCIYSIIEPSGWKSERDRERESIGTMGVKRDDNDNDKPFWSIGFIVIVGIVFWDDNNVCACAWRKKYENSTMRFDSFYTISKWKIFSGNSLTDQYEDIEHTAGSFSIINTFLSFSFRLNCFIQQLFFLLQDWY